MAEPTEPQETPECPFCGNDRDLERDGQNWICPVCAKTWIAFNRADKRMLKVARIAPD